MDDNNDGLPTYQDVLNEDQQIKRRNWYLQVSSVIFLVIDVIMSVAAITMYFIMRYIDLHHVRKIDVKKHCFDPRYNFPTPVISNLQAHISVITVVVACGILSLIRSRFEYGKDIKRMIKRAAWEIWIILMNLIFLFVLITFLNCATGVPSPYYFNNTQLNNYFCNNTLLKKGKREVFSVKLEALDDQLRRSFPSLKAALYSFCISIIYLYIDHFDIGHGVHSIQHILVTLVGSSLCYLFSQFVKTGENHLADVIVGVAIGIYQAIVTIRSIYGKALYSLKPLHEEAALRILTPEQQLPRLANHSLPSVPEREPTESSNYDQRSISPPPIPERRPRNYEQPPIPPRPTAPQFETFDDDVLNNTANMCTSTLCDNNDTQPFMVMTLLPINTRDSDTTAGVASIPSGDVNVENASHITIS